MCVCAGVVLECVRECACECACAGVVLECVRECACE